MKSPMEDLPVRSMLTVSSAFMSSRRARTTLSVSCALTRGDTASGERDARESAGVGRGAYPFMLLHAPGANRDVTKDNYSADALPVHAAFRPLDKT